MSVNTAHANNGVLLHAGELILLFSDKVSMEFSGQDNSLFKGSKTGKIFLTTHRMVFNNNKQSDPLQSVSFPFVALNDVELEQPVFGANYIKGKVRAQPNGNFVGEAKFKLAFKAGGAIEFGQAMLRAASMAQRNMHNTPGGMGGFDNPPPYQPANGWHEAPPPAYEPPPGYYGWVPMNNPNFTGVPPNSVFVTDNPPPYPGIGAPPQQSYPNPGYQNPQTGWVQPPGQQNFNAGPQQPYGGYPQGPGPQQPYSNAGYPQGPGPQQPYPNPGYPQGAVAGPQQPYAGYPMGGQPGFGSTAPYSKEDEANFSYNANANVNNNNYRQPGDAPPRYEDLPPGYGGPSQRQ